jgi:Zn-finger nucleic acid-binding protein
MQTTQYCPICKTVQLVHHTMPDSGVPSYQCPRCEGIWIAANEYLRWAQTQDTVLPEKLDTGGDIPNWDIAQLKVCPGCGHFLTRYRVLPGVPFYLDRCSQCNGVWLDKNEWGVLVEHNLHDKVNQLFTQPWQAKIQKAEARAMLDKLYTEKFGAEDYAKIQEMGTWLRNHPQRAMLMAFLQAKEPYEI